MRRFRIEELSNQMKYNHKMSFVHHIIRPLWSIPIGLIYLLVCSIIWLCSSKKRADYNRNKKAFSWPTSLQVFAGNFREVYKYRWDGFGGIVELLKNKEDENLQNYLNDKTSHKKFMFYAKIYIFLIKIFTPLRGLLDHDNWPLEHFMYFGDCDDCIHVMASLRKMSLEVYRIGMIGEKLNTWHYDCVIKGYDMIWNEDVFYLFNYGNLVRGICIDQCLDKLSRMYGWKDLYKYETMSYWKCKY